MTIKELRLEKGLTPAAFAESIGIGLSTLDSYESGQSTPSAKALAAITDLYGVELSSPALVEAAEAVEAVVVGEAVEEALDETVIEEAGAEEAAEEAVTEEAATEEAATEESGTDATVEEAAEEAPEAAAEEAVDEAAIEEAPETDTEKADEEATIEEGPEADTEEAAEEAVSEEAVEETAEEETAEEAALIAAAEKAARKAAKKARKAEQLAARQRADEEATRRVIDIISALSGGVNLDDRDAVAAARDAYDSLTDDQELLIPGDVLRLLFGAEVQIEVAEEAAAKEAAKPASIGECRITVKDVTYTGKKIKKPSVKVVWGDTALEPGEDYSLKYDKKARDIGLYTLTVKGKGRFIGSAKAPFYVVPKASEYVRLLGGDKQADRAWKLLKNIEGYQIEYSPNKDLSDSKKAKIRKPKDLAKVLMKLKAGKKYYLRVRLFATVKKKHHYSDWSKVKTVKV